MEIEQVAELTFCLPKSFYEHTLKLLEMVRYAYPTSAQFAADIDLAIGQCRYAIAEIKKAENAPTERDQAGQGRP